ACGPARQRLSSSGGLRAEVVDSGCGFDPLLSPLSRDQEYGWGLHLVDRIADRWGVDRGDQTTVWFEINW
ncbi:MAG: ATP-binding protein, partial [Actinomycetota bacterium]